MRSHIRQDRNSYSGIEAPRYNVLSYTWGYYKDENETPIPVYGIDWPIPGIKRSHFMVETFQNTIKSAARGVKHACEWLWVDVACIPQEHNDESKQSKDVRDQEIGRQVEICDGS
ncbi:HET domain containing protein [Pyrenophora tritici-repentis]|nr:HET domain-containing protein [Pyrenophora tritici-repentis]KAF7574198.1 HET domain containing protein [Pyrenophora tritici-repentis]KAG9386992.1 HET domain containing protein [Pyrenophora tritici-repentis]KAI0570563.1 HET domain-containing protein [Pyrenophora tritici-repentis]KAI0571992.1 HET domain-containing protein [Pyrenophora tritici-repentis]